jgi:hypothetical protein
MIQKMKQPSAIVVAVLLAACPASPKIELIPESSGRLDETDPVCV